MNISNSHTQHLLHFKYLLSHSGISSLTKELFCMTTKASNCCHWRMKLVICLQISCNIFFYPFYINRTIVPQKPSLFLQSPCMLEHLFWGNCVKCTATWKGLKWDYSLYSLWNDFVIPGLILGINQSKLHLKTSTKFSQIYRSQLYNSKAIYITATVCLPIKNHPPTSPLHKKKEKKNIRLFLNKQH